MTATARRLPFSTLRLRLVPGTRLTVVSSGFGSPREGDRMTVVQCSRSQLRYEPDGRSCAHMLPWPSSPTGVRYEGDEFTVSYGRGARRVSATFRIERPGADALSAAAATAGWRP